MSTNDTASPPSARRIGDADVVAVQGFDPALAGAITYWRLSGGVNGERLGAAWKERGLPEALLPTLPSPETALTRAVKKHEGRRNGTTILARQLPEARGWVLKHETPNADNSDLTYSTEARVWVDKLGRFQTDRADSDLSRAVEVEYPRQLAEVSAADVSSWLVRMAAYVTAVSLRDAGGVYFIPRGTLPTWRGMVHAIRAASSHAVFEIPAMRGEECVAAVLDALNAECDEEVKRMEAEITAATGGLSKRGIATREAHLDRLRGKVEGYCTLLGARQEELVARLEAVRASLATGRIANGDLNLPGLGLTE